MESAILAGKSSDALQAAVFALSKGMRAEDIVEGILRAWASFCEWYDRDPKESLKAWANCYTATMKILKLLDSNVEKNPPPESPPFSVMVATVKGEGHVLMKEIIVTLLKSKGLKVYSMKKGVLLEDMEGALADPSLKFIVLSCIEGQTEDRLCNLVKGIRVKRPDIKIVAGGPAAYIVRADIAPSDPSAIYASLTEGSLP